MRALSALVALCLLAAPTYAGQIQSGMDDANAPAGAILKGANDIGSVTTEFHYLWDDGSGGFSYCTGTYVIFDFRITNSTGNTITSLQHGFQVYSPTGAEWGSTEGIWAIPNIGSLFNLNFGIQEFSVTGSGADTIGFYGSGMASGLPAGWDSVTMKVRVGPISDSYGGGNHTLCLDSSWFPPAGIWSWQAGGSVFPEWDGPHCYPIMVIPGDDPDQDGAYTGCDNCPDAYNPDQTDSDWDSEGDACEDCCQMIGDVDYDGDVDIGDVVYLVSWMFGDGPLPPCMAHVDMNGDGQGPNIADVIYFVSWMFQNGPPLPDCP
jgi:hypothetical protein